MKLRSLILKVACVVGLAWGFLAQAQVVEVTTYFVPAMMIRNVYGSLDGIYLELRPNGKFVSAEILGGDIGGCEGSYGIQDNVLRIVLERCGILEQKLTGELGLAKQGLEEAKYLVTQEIILKDGSFMTIISGPRIYEMFMNMIAARPDGPLMRSRSGMVLAYPGDILSTFVHVANH